MNATTTEAATEIETERWVLWSSERFAARIAPAVADAGIALDHVELRGMTYPSAAELERVTCACLSTDAFPDRYPLLIRGCREAPNLRWLHTFSAGVDRPIFRELMDRGVVVTTSAGSAAGPIAETVMMYLLALTRDLPGWMRAQSEHRWDQRRIGELAGRRIAVVGYGPIGREVIRLSVAFGMEPVAVRRRAVGDEVCTVWPIDLLAELVPDIDVLVLAVPLTDDTAGLVDAAVIAAVRPGMLLVNVGRGPLIDEDALIEALREGRIGGAGLDVFATEPLPADSALWDLDRVIVTPHSSGLSFESDQRAAGFFVDNLIRWVGGRGLVNRA